MRAPSQERHCGVGAQSARLENPFLCPRLPPCESTCAASHQRGLGKLQKEDTLDRKKSWEPCLFPCRSSSSSKVAGPSCTRDNVLEEPGHRVFGS